MALGLSYPSSTLDTQRVELDKQIRLLEEQTSQLKRRRNGLSSAIRLPPELLSRIFIMLRDDHFHQAEDASNRYRWMAVTFVCHHWRDVALSACALWSRVDSTRVRSDEHGLTLLSRAHMVPLSVKVDVTSCPRVGERFLQHLSANMGHTRELSLTGHLTSAKEYQYQPLLASSTPSLESLLIENTAFLGHGVVNIPRELITNSPRLHNVFLSGCHISLSRGEFQSLKQLRLKNCTLNDLNSVLESLSSMSQLRHLEVGNVTFIDNLSSADLHSAYLPNLERLDMSGCLRYCAKLARHLVTPNTTRWRLSATSLDGQTHLEDLIEYTRRFNNVLRSKGHHLKRTAIVRHSGLCTNSVAASWSEGSEEHDVCIEVREAEHEWTGPICAALAISDVKLVDAYGAARDVLSAWGNPGLLTSAETLILRDDGRSRSSFNFDEDQPSYPRLRTLVVLEQQYGPSHFSALAEWVHQRSRRGRSVSQLVLRGSKRWHARHFCPTMLQKLREAVGTVCVEELKDPIPAYVQLAEMGKAYF